MHNLSRLSVQPDEILCFLKQALRFKEIYHEFLHQKIIVQASQEKGLVVTSEEIQAEADRIRHEKRLEKAADTLAWLADEMITSDDWEVGIRDRLLFKKLAESIFGKEVEKFYAQNRFNFDQVLLYQIIVPYERVAQELYYQIEEQEISFYEAAHLYDVDEKRRHQCGYEGKLARQSFKPDIAAVVFNSQPGAIIGPLQTEQGYHLFMVEEFISAELTPEKYQEILESMFTEWLAGELSYLVHSRS